jgi:hypothetical protein
MVSTDKGTVGLELRDDTCAELAATYASLRSLMEHRPDGDLTWWIAPDGRW